MKKKCKEGPKEPPKGQMTPVGHYAHLKYMLDVPKRAQRVAGDIRVLNSTFATLFSDENFVTLLRAESITVPAYLKPLLEEGVIRAHEDA